MKICYVSHYLIEHDYIFLKKLVERGYDTYLVAITPRDIPENIRAIRNLTVFHKSIDYLGATGKYLYPLFVPYLRSVLAKIKPDVLHSGWLPKDGLVSALSGFHPHLSMPWGSEIIEHPYENFLYRLVAKTVFGNADMVTVDAEFVKDIITSEYRYPANRIVVFPWGVDHGSFNPSIRRNEIRVKLGWEKNVVLVMNRNFRPFYNVHGFVEAIPQILSSCSDVRVLLIGTGPLEATIRKLVDDLRLANIVHLAGWVHHAEMSAYLNSADIYISNSNTDGTSVSLLEAMACGLPVVVTNLPAIREWVTDDHNGYIVEPENRESLSQKIIMMANDRDARMKFSKNNLALAKGRADWEKNFTKLEGIYERLSPQKRT